MRNAKQAEDTIMINVENTYSENRKKKSKTTLQSLSLEKDAESEE